MEVSTAKTTTTIETDERKKKEKNNFDNLRDRLEIN